MLVTLLPLTLASDTQHRFRVYVRIFGDDEQAVRTIESHLKRELRLLGDVDVVGADDDWRYIIDITVMSTEYRDGRKSGDVALGTYHAIRLNESYYRSSADYKSMKAIWASQLGIAYYSIDNLPNFCINYVNDFDKEILAFIRSLLRGSESQ